MSLLSDKETDDGASDRGHSAAPQKIQPRRARRQEEKRAAAEGRWKEIDRQRPREPFDPLIGHSRPASQQNFSG